jgi:hypothetical protein
MSERECNGHDPMHPEVLGWKDCFGTDREYEMAFGYDATDGEPTAALMWEGCDHPISIPITVMLEAICTGWGNLDTEVVTMLAQFLAGNKVSAFMPGDPALN